jgi:hypothetical protein
MDDMTLNLIVLAVFVLLGAGIFLGVRRKQAEKEQIIIRLAANKGWSYESIREPLAWGMRLKSSGWTLEALSRSNGRETSPGSTDLDMSTIWQSPHPGSTLLINARTSRADLGSIGEMLTRQVLQLALGDHANGLKEIKFGSSTFQQKYMLWAQDQLAAERMLTPALQSNLIDWKGIPPLIKRASGVLSIEIKGKRITNPDEILALVTLGNLLAKEN